MKKKLLFICSANYDRSPTAEMLFKDSEKYEAKSAGILPNAIKNVDKEMINWADIIFVISEKEDGHYTYLRDRFNLNNKEIHDLDIPNIFIREDPELIKLLKIKLSKYLTLKSTK